MATMTKELAALVNEEIRADMLIRLDNKLRREIQDEEIFMTWLEEGLPDGLHNAAEVLELDISPEEFAEMWNLAERLLNEDLKGRE